MEKIEPATTEISVLSFLIMNPLTDILQRCHQRHEDPLRQRKTVAASVLYKGFPYCFKVYCAHHYPVMLDNLEQADISFMPIGRAPENDRGPRDFGGERFLKPQRAANWRPRRWLASWGIQVYTGTPSERDGAPWHDINFKYEALCAAPDAVLACVEALVNAVENPLLTMLKDGGLRFSCRIPDYLHPSAHASKQYIYKHNPASEVPHHRDVYLEILGEAGYSCWDARYEILMGNLLDPPLISEGVLFAPIDVLRAALHEPTASRESELEPAPIASPPLGSHNLELAREAFLKRGFSYVRQEGTFHHWVRCAGRNKDVEMTLWEDAGTVWVRAATPNGGLTTKPTPITDVWNNTGILPPIPPAGFRVSDTILAIREGTLSPLAIKRPRPILQKPEATKAVDDETPEKPPVQRQNIFDRDARILGLTTETGIATDAHIDAYLGNGGTVCLNMANDRAAREAVEHFQERNVSSVIHWKSRMYRWGEVKAIPVDERMETPFQRGNVCEDAERCETFEEKGGNADEVICPKCPVYTECQQRGYLAQATALQNAKVQIVATPRIFFNLQSRYAEMWEKVLQHPDKAERLCVVEVAKAYELFPIYQLPKDVLETWIVRWEGSVLGDFARFLLNAIEINGTPDSSAVQRVRAAFRAFASEEDTLIKQMCQVNTQGRVIAHAVVDEETGEELARFRIAFEGGASAYIPLNTTAAERLTVKGLPHLQLHDFAVNEEVRIPMPMAEAVELGILDTTTVENIQAFPTVCRNPNWTSWHQLKCFFDYYPRDTDAPMVWDNEVLMFWAPPILHPRVKRLLLLSANFSERHLRRTFPNDDIEIIPSEPAAWGAGNQIFQIRTGNYTLETIVDYDNTWDVPSLSEVAQRFFLGIRAEIERAPSVKHAIITYQGIISYVEDFAEKENVCLVSAFNEARHFKSTLKEADVLWIVGTPYWAQSVIWHRSQILFGNHEIPLSYKKEDESDVYSDEHVQSVYEQNVVNYLTEVIGYAGLALGKNRKVVLITSFPLPGITDRPETLLFDWEDFEVAGRLDKLAEVIATRQQFETERANLTADSKREEVERIWGCSSRQANRILKRLRGGKPLRVPFREQILSLLSNGEKKTAALVAAIEGHPKAVNNELTRLVETGEIVKIQRGVYALPPPIAGRK